MGIKEIMSGTINNVLGKEQNLFDKRITICKECKLFLIDKLFGPVCNHGLFLNPITNTTSKKEESGFYRGCGCILGSKCRSVNSKCPTGKW